MGALPRRASAGWGSAGGPAGGGGPGAPPRAGRKPLSRPVRECHRDRDGARALPSLEYGNRGDAASSPSGRSSPGSTSGASCSPSPPTGPTSLVFRAGRSRDGDDWIVKRSERSGTTLAHKASWAMLLTRTDPDVPQASGPVVLPDGHDQPGGHRPAACFQLDPVTPSFKRRLSQRRSRAAREHARPPR